MIHSSYRLGKNSSYYNWHSCQRNREWKEKKPHQLKQNQNKHAAADNTKDRLFSYICGYSLHWNELLNVLASVIPVKKITHKAGCFLSFGSKFWSEVVFCPSQGGRTRWKDSSGGQDRLLSLIENLTWHPSLGSAAGDNYTFLLHTPNAPCSMSV